MEQSHGPTEETGMPGSRVGVVSDGAQRSMRDNDSARTTECPSWTR